MKQAEIKQGHAYMAKVSGRIIPLFVDCIEVSNASARWRIRYYCTSMATKRSIIVRSA